MTKEYESIIDFANSDRSTFEKIRKNRPSSGVVETALEDYINNCTLSNCAINYGYLEALGLKVK